MECITAKEHTLISELRERAKSLSMPAGYSKDKDLVRWLRARNHRVDEAERMLRDNLAWRREFKIDALTKMDVYLPPEHSHLLQFDIYGFDDDGGVVHLIKGSTINMEKTVRLGLQEKVFQHTMGNLEKAWRINVKHSEGKDHIPKFVSIYDLAGMTAGQFSSTESINLGVNLARKMDINYPECVNRIFIVNAPWAFQIIWKCLKAILAQRTTERFVIIGSDKNEQRMEISKFLRLHQFPQRYGGDGSDSIKSLEELEEDYAKSSNAQTAANSL